jgi:hypothetical protein
LENELLPKSHLLVLLGKQVDVILAGKWLEDFPMHEIGRIDGGRGFRTGRNVIQIGGNKFTIGKMKF